MDSVFKDALRAHSLLLSVLQTLTHPSQHVQVSQYSVCMECMLSVSRCSLSVCVCMLHVTCQSGITIYRSITVYVYLFT